MCEPPETQVARSEKAIDRDAESRSIHSAQSVAPSENTTIADNESHDVEAALERTNTPKKPLVKVARSQRRGLFARFALIAEVTEPKDYKNSTKWFITFIIGIAAAAAPVGSAIIFPTLDQIAKEFNSTAAIVNLSVALYMLSMAIFPLWWSAFSETSGRRSIYIVSFGLFILWSVLSALARNIAMLIVLRMLAGGASASVQAVGAGTIADIFEVRERGKAMGIFYLGPLCGPLLAPIIGGVVGEAWNWRATQWVLVIYGGKY